MKPEQLNRAIAEREGWTCFAKNGWFTVCRPDGTYSASAGDIDRAYAINCYYTTSLDAIVPLVRKLEGQDKWLFGKHMYQIHNLTVENDSYTDLFDAVSSTALQLATAYAKTKGIWK